MVNMAEVGGREFGNSCQLSWVRLAAKVFEKELDTDAARHRNFGTITIVPAVPSILNHFHESGKFYLTFLVSIWEFGEAIGQGFVGPATERFGRRPVFVAGNVLFLLFPVASALSINIQMLTAFRFLNGFVNTTLTLGPTVIGDLFEVEQRGRALAISIALPLLGPFVAPVVGSYTNAKLGWRWTIWIVVISVALNTGLSFVFFKETSKAKLLEREAAESRTAGPTATDGGTRKDLTNIRKSILRPVVMLFTSPKLFLVAFYSSFTYGISYLVLTTLTDVMQSVYSFSESGVGNAFLARGKFPRPSSHTNLADDAKRSVILLVWLFMV